MFVVTIMLFNSIRQPVVIWMNGRCTSGIIWIGSDTRPIVPMSSTSRIAAMTATGLESARRVRFTRAPRGVFFDVVLRQTGIARRGS